MDTSSTQQQQQQGRPVVIYDRTSRDEAVGQDVRAGAAQVRAAVEARGFTVLGAHLDEDTSGDTEPASRPGWRGALEEAQRLGCPIAMREFSRFSRQHPLQALAAFDGLPVPVVCLAEPHFSTVDCSPDEDSALLLRMVTAWSSWREKRGAARRTALAMAEITSGRRPTKSGRAPGRPEKSITDEERGWCLEQLQQGVALVRIHDGLLRRRGYFDVIDTAARKRRYIGRETLRGLLTDNPTLPKTT